MRLPASVVTFLANLLGHQSFSFVEYFCVSYRHANRIGILESRENNRTFLSFFPNKLCRSHF
jgi:hypothetical protein